MPRSLPALLVGLALLASPALSAASAARIEYLNSPEAHQTTSDAEPAEKRFYWDDATGRFAVALTYPASPHAEAQTVHFHFPRVRQESGKRSLVLDLGNGRTVAVAHKLFFGPIHLADRNHLQVHRRHGVVRVTLEIEE